MDYGAIYGSLIEKAQARGWRPGNKADGTHTHHITPRCMGGWDAPDNLVVLTFKEHVFAHKLLAKMYPGVPGNIMAAVMMSKTSTDVMSRHKEARRFYSKYVWNPMMEEEYREARRGEKNARAVLNNELVLEIRKLHSEGLSNKQISQATGIYMQHVYAVVKRKCSKHI